MTLFNLRAFTDLAACYRTDYDGGIDVSRDEIWFHSSTALGRSPAKRLDMARDICATCPILHECFEAALAEDERFAIRAGVDFGARELRKRGRQRREDGLRRRFEKFVKSL